MPRRGRSYYERFKGPDTGGSTNNIHKGVMSVIKATIARMDEDRGHPFVMYQPLIVLEGRLFEAFLGDTRQIALVKQPWIPLSFSYRSPAYDNRRFTVLFVEEANLPDLLRRFRRHFTGVGTPVRPESATAKAAAKALETQGISTSPDKLLWYRRQVAE